VKSFSHPEWTFIVEGPSVSTRAFGNYWDAQWYAAANLTSLVAWRWEQFSFRKYVPKELELAAVLSTGEYIDCASREHLLPENVVAHTQRAGLFAARQRQLALQDQEYCFEVEARRHT
jgi:hypothetical protein